MARGGFSTENNLIQTKLDRARTSRGINRRRASREEKLAAGDSRRFDVSLASRCSLLKTQEEMNKISLAAYLQINYGTRRAGIHLLRLLSPSVKQILLTSAGKHLTNHAGASTDTQLALFH